jgi:hypothetical protein
LWIVQAPGGRIVGIAVDVRRVDGHRIAVAVNRVVIQREAPVHCLQAEIDDPELRLVLVVLLEIELAAE